MKRKMLRVLLQPHPKQSFWIENTLSGMASEAEKCSHTLYIRSALPEKLGGETVYIVGSDESFCHRMTEAVTQAGGEPFLVNGGMLEPETAAGVAFDIEGAVKNCLSYLAACGKRRILLFGLNRNSYADRHKYDAFVSLLPKFGITGHAEFCTGTIGEAAGTFVEGFRAGDADAILCANDTAALSLLFCKIAKKSEHPEGSVPCRNGQFLSRQVRDPSAHKRGF